MGTVQKAQGEGGEYMTLGSLFDGSGGFPLAGTLCGIEPLWASEIEPFPIAVTKARFPQMKHYGDVSMINGAEVPAVDIITFGSPCQDLSVAGKRAGIQDGERSSLFFQAVRIIKEMRNHDKSTGRTDEHIRPRFAVWENVPGAFSSNKGEDFRCVLEALAEVEGGEVSVPRPADGKWQSSGEIVGDGWSIAWRVFDAQYWGVPQRRKRIYLVADFASERAGEILFEQESEGRYPTPSREAWQGTAGDSASGIDAIVYSICLNDSNSMKSGNPYSGIYEATTTRTLDANGGNPLCNQGGMCICESVAFSQNQREEVSDLGDKAGALAAEPGIHQQTFVIEGNGSRPSHLGEGYRESDTMYTLNTTEVHGVAYAIENHAMDSRVKIEHNGTVQTLSERMGTGGVTCR